MPDEYNLKADDKAFLTSLCDEALEHDPRSLFSEVESIDQRYSEDEAFASGGSKDITSCIDKATGRLVAKAVLQEIKNDSDVESFLREARITASLQHPNILPVYDIGIEESGNPFFTMKLVEGKSLHDLLDEVRDNADVPLGYLVEIFIKVTEAVAYAHSKGVIHLDIKPDNVQISDYGEVLLCDWGLAKILEDKWEDESFEEYSISESFDLKKTMDGFIKGTPGYLSPEQAVPGKKCDERSDIYSLGALLYEILTGKKPVDGDQIEDVLINTLEGDIKDPLELKNNIPKSLAAVCMKALKTDPADRYQSVRELLGDILSYTRGYATNAEEAGFVDNLRHFLRRNAAVALMSLIFIVISIVALIIFIVNLKEREAVAQAERTIAQRERNKALNALEMVRKEKQVSTFYSNKFIEDLVSDAEKAFDAKDYEKVERYLKYVGKQGNELLCRVKLMQGKFAEAQDIIKTLEGKHKEELTVVHDLFVRMENENKNDLKTSLNLLTDNEGLYLNAEDILKVESLGIRKILLQKFLPRLDFKERIKIVTEIIKEEDGLDPKFTFICYKKDNGTFVVDISNSKFRSIEYLKYIGPVESLRVRSIALKSLEELASMPVKSLNIRGTSVTDLTPLKNTPIEKLDLRETIVKDLSPLYDIETLKSVTVTNGKFTKNQLRRFPDTVKVMGGGSGD